MTPGPGLDLGRPRDVGDLFRDSLRLYARHFGLFLPLAVAVVAPVQLVVSGIGLEELTSAYRSDNSLARTGIPTAVSFLVATPLVTAAVIFALGSISKGEPPRSGPSLQAALDVFAPLFGAVLLAAAGHRARPARLRAARHLRGGALVFRDADGGDRGLTRNAGADP